MRLTAPGDATAMPHTVWTPSTKTPTTVKVTLWVKPTVKAELERLAKLHGLSLSKTGAAGLEAWVQQQIHDQQEALLYPIIRQIIREELRSFGNRLVFFLMRIAYAAEQSRILITNVLDRLLRRDGVGEQTITSLVDQSNRKARRNIIHKSPQLQTLMEEWEATEREEEDGKPTN